MKRKKGMHVSFLSSQRDRKKRLREFWHHLRFHFHSSLVTVEMLWETRSQSFSNCMRKHAIYFTKSYLEMSGEGLWWKASSGIFLTCRYSEFLTTRPLSLTNSFMSELVKSYGQEFFIALMLEHTRRSCKVSAELCSHRSFVVLASSNVWWVIRPFPFSHTHNTVMKINCALVWIRSAFTPFC